VSVQRVAIPQELLVLAGIGNIGVIWAIRPGFIVNRPGKIGIVGFGVENRIQRWNRQWWGCKSGSRTGGIRRHGRIDATIDATMTTTTVELKINNFADVRPIILCRIVVVVDANHPPLLFVCTAPFFFSVVIHFDNLI